MQHHLGYHVVIIVCLLGASYQMLLRDTIGSLEGLWVTTEYETPAREKDVANVTQDEYSVWRWWCSEHPRSLPGPAAPRGRCGAGRCGAVRGAEAPRRWQGTKSRARRAGVAAPLLVLP